MDGVLHIVRKSGNGVSTHMYWKHTFSIFVSMVFLVGCLVPPTSTRIATSNLTSTSSASANASDFGPAPFFTPAVLITPHPANFDRLENYRDQFPLTNLTFFFHCHLILEGGGNFGVVKLPGGLVLRSWAPCFFEKNGGFQIDYVNIPIYIIHPEKDRYYSAFCIGTTKILDNGKPLEQWSNSDFSYAQCNRSHPGASSYTVSVAIGNGSEEIHLDEDIFKDTLEETGWGDVFIKFAQTGDTSILPSVEEIDHFMLAYLVINYPASKGDY